MKNAQFDMNTESGKFNFIEESLNEINHSFNHYYGVQWVAHGIQS